MLRTCVDYLMLEDFNWAERIPDDKGVRREISQAHQEMWDAHRKPWDESDDESDSELSADAENEHGSAFSGNNLTEPPLRRWQPPMSSKTDPCGAFFKYAARCWKDHLGIATVDFNLDDVLELASPTSARHELWMLESSFKYPRCSQEMKPSALCLIAGFANTSVLEQQLDRLAQNGDGDRRRRG